VHAVTTATAGFPVAIVTVGKPLADAGPPNHPEQRKHLFLHSGCMQLPQLPRGFLLQYSQLGNLLQMRARPIILYRKNTCFYTPGACSYHSYHRVSCCNCHSWETSCRCRPIQSSCTKKTLVSTLRVHAVTTATAGFSVAIVTVGKPLADVGPSNHPELRKHLFLHSGCMQLQQLPQGFLLQ
jgi:hypothetical protein